MSAWCTTFLTVFIYKVYFIYFYPFLSDCQWCLIICFDRQEQFWIWFSFWRSIPKKCTCVLLEPFILLVLKLRESPLEMFLRLDYGQTSRAICNKTSNLNSRFHISDLYKSIGLFNLFGNETIYTFTDMPCDHIYTLHRCIIIIL